MSAHYYLHCTCALYVYNSHAAGAYAGGRSWSGCMMAGSDSLGLVGDAPLISPSLLVFSLSLWEGEGGQTADIQKYMYTWKNYGTLLLF